MNWIVVFLVYVLSVGAIGIENNGQVDECPSGRAWDDMARQMCISHNNQMTYHCLPDKNGNLYQFCAVSRSNVSISYYQVENGEFYYQKNDEAEISRTDSEFYSNLSLIIINASRGYIPNKKPVFSNYRFLIEEIRKSVDSNICGDGTQEHILPERFSCDIKNVCLKPRQAPLVEHIPVVKLPISDGKGNLIEKDFRMPQTNNEEYEVLSLALCLKHQGNKCKNCQNYPKYKCTNQRETMCKDSNGFTTYLANLGFFFFGMLVVVVLMIGLNFFDVVEIHRSTHFPRLFRGGPNYEVGHPKGDAKPKVEKTVTK